uniref:Retrovirus-related Pol polyprotein from transposon TNT 1-94 n=1 Tax=Cajanus cajan TaxID=3821 RepID=A0A151UC73_CAJCA|nr:Retrovirus-related Pol polyprotein from transposon TNT 1-94 [Cajanus cajan]
MTNNVAAFSNVTNYSNNLQIHIVDGNNLPIITIGDISSSLTNAYVSPDLITNLISVGQLVDNNCKVEFSKSGCLVQDQHSRIMIAKGPKVGCHFPLYSSMSQCSFLSFISCNFAIVSFQTWHKRLGHPNCNVLHDLMKSSVLGIQNFPSLSVVQFDCLFCKLDKSKILPFSVHQSNINHPFEMIHSDLWGITPVISHAHYECFITFIDDYNRFTWVYFLYSKTNAFFALKFFHAYVNTKFLSKIKILHVDNGGNTHLIYFNSFGRKMVYYPKGHVLPYPHLSS